VDIPTGSGTYDFQTSGTATFRYFTDFSVLNIINTVSGAARAAKFNGTTQSRIEPFSGVPSTGGTVWFYSPGGLIVGAGASFNVGSLFLTTATPFDQSQTFATGNVNLSSPAGSTSAIIVEPGASITAGNYVAMLAPHVEQGGTVRAGGEIAYVAAEGANISFPTGSNLFTIDVNTGTTATNGQGQVLVHTGTSGGPAAGANTPNRNIYFLAMPKNTAVTSLLSGTIGYDAATSAAVNSEGIVLLSGGVILNGQPYINNDFEPLPGNINETPGNITIDSGATFNQNVTAFGTNITSQALTGDITFLGSATLRATVSNTVNVATGHTLFTGRDLSLYAQGRDNNFSLVGGTVTANVSGTLLVGSSTSSNTGLLMDAESQGASEFDGTGGTVALNVTGGSVYAGINGITLNANGTGGAGLMLDGGNGIGGTATLTMAGTVGTQGRIQLSALGLGGDTPSGTAGDGTGGTASLTSAPGNGVTAPQLFANQIAVSAGGTGGAGFCQTACTPNGALGGVGTGGSAIFSATDTDVTIAGLSLNASGMGGMSDNALYSALPGTGGDGIGGLASATFTRGTIIADSLIVAADGTGGEGGHAIEGTSGSVTTSGPGGNGGQGIGGLAANGLGASLTISGSTFFSGEGVPGISISADGKGGKGGFSDDDVGGNGGNAIGGDASYTQNGAANVSGDMAITAVATGGQGGGSQNSFSYSTGGDATGGSSTFLASRGLYAGTLTQVANTLEGFGGANVNDPSQGFHGVMQAGRVSTAVDTAAVTLDDYTADTSSNTGTESGLQFHDAFTSGGNVAISVSGDGSLTVQNTLLVNTSASNMGGTQGGADAQAGAVSIQAITEGSISALHTSIQTQGFGGFSSLGNGGNGSAGAVSITANDGTLNLGTVNIDAYGGSGSGVSGGNIGRGGDIAISLDNGGTLAAAGGLNIDAQGVTFAGNNIATGGTISLRATNGIYTVNGLTARATGNLQSNPGTSNGGLIRITTDGTQAGASGFGNALLDASGRATGGQIAITNTVTGSGAALTFGSLNATAAGANGSAPAITIASTDTGITGFDATLSGESGIAFAGHGNGSFYVTNGLTANTTGAIAIDGTGSTTPAIQANTLMFTSAAINGTGATTVQTSSMTLTTPTVAAPGISFQSGNINLVGIQSIVAKDLIAAGTLGPGHVSLTGALTISGEMAAGSGGIDFSAPGAISIGKVVLGDTSPLKLVAGGALSLTQVATPGAITLTSGGAISALSVAGGSSVTATAANGIAFLSLAGASAALTANGGDITGGVLTVAGKASLQASGAVRLSDPVGTGTGSVPAGFQIPAGVNDSLGNGGDLVINAGGLILVNDAVVGGRALLTGGGAVSINSLRSGGDLTITTPGNIGFSSLAGNAVSLTSTGASVSGQSLAASYTTNLAASTLLQVTSLSSADVVTASGRQVNLLAPGALTLASLIGTNSVLVTAGGLLTINGSVQGTTIDLGSQSIAIGSTARIGTAGTTTNVTLRNTGTGRSFIGTTGTGYSLAAAGLARVQADAITLVLPQVTGSSAAQPDVVIGDVTLHGSTGTASGTLANLTSAGSFTVQTAGRVQVAGKLALTDIATGNAATITAGQGIDVVTPSGQILLTDTAGNAQGTLTLTAPGVTVASASAMTDLAGLTTYSQRETRLARNDGSTVEQGYIVGGHLVFRVANALYIQNSGASSSIPDRRGFTAGTAGVDVFATGTTLPEIIINGRQATTGGAFISSLDLRPLVRTANASGTVDASSVLAVNGCTPTRCSLTSPIDIAFTYLPMVPPPQDTEELVADDGDTAQTLPVLTQPLITLPVTTPYSFAPVIDEPVTGVGVETVSFGTGPDAANSVGTGNVGTGNVGTGNEGGATGNGSQNGNVGTGPAGNTIGTGTENGNVGTGNENGNVGTGPATGNVGTGPASGNVGTGPEGGTQGTNPQNPGSGNGPQNGTLGNGPNGNVGTGPNVDAPNRAPGR